MKLLIVCDAEGCYTYLSEREASRAMCIELRIVLDKLLEDGKYEVSVMDMHGNGHNVNELIPDYKEVTFIHHICGMDCFKYDVAVIIGMHARSGVNSPVAHTFRSEILDVRLDNKSVGEYALLYNWLAYYKIPVCFVSGEAELEKEILEYSPNVPFSLYAENTGNKVEAIELMCERMIQNLKIPNDIQEYSGETIYVRLKRKYYYDFFPEKVFVVEGDQLVFSCTFEMISHLFLLSNVIDVAELFFRTYFYYINQKMDLLFLTEEKDRFKDENKKVFRKNRSELETSEIVHLWKSLNKSTLKHLPQNAPL